MKHARSVPLELLCLYHGGILPETKLVLRVPVAAQELFLKGRPLERAHLAAGVHTVEHGSAGCVPEFDASVSSASSRRL